MTSTQSTTTAKARQCPGCGAITDSFEHCHRRPSPMFPQLDESEATVPVLVQVVDHLCYPRFWTDPERRERQCSRGTKACEVDHG